MSLSELKKENTDVEQDITLYLSDFWRGFVKFWWVGVALAIILGFLMFYQAYRNFVPYYTATATYTVHIKNETLSGDGGMSAYSFYYDRTTADQLAIVFPYVLRSNILQERVCKELNTPVMPATVTVSCIPGTNMLTVTTIGTEPQAVYNTLLSVVNNYSYVTEYIIGPTKLVTISSPEIPTEAANTMSWKSSTLKGVLVGLAVGVAWIVLYAILRQTIRTKEDIYQELNQTCIGVLPQVTFKRYKRDIDTRILISNSMVGQEFHESLRLLRSAIQNGLKAEEKVILISSTAPGEGKSSVTLNLASIFAQNNQRVLVIDGDLRSSGISQLLNYSVKQNRTPSFYNIHHIDELGLDVLTFQTQQRHLWKILRGFKLREIISVLREQYDLILIDTPPCGIISDAEIIADVSDAALYVIRQDTVLSNRIREGISTLQATDVRLLGCILNGALGGLGGYGNYYGYRGYNHYYRYGYSNKNKTKKEF